jgi:hypothetical protein
MIERRGRARFSKQPLPGLRIRSVVSGEELQSNGAAKLDVISEINLSHPSSAKPRADLVTPEPGASWKLCH